MGFNKIRSKCEASHENAFEPVVCDMSTIVEAPVCSDLIRIMFPIAMCEYNCQRAFVPAVHFAVTTKMQIDIFSTESKT